MPMYDYECLECGKVFEHHQSFSESNLELCLCSDEQFLVKRRLSVPTIMIKEANTMTDRKLYKELDID
jgi:putative FmdB family regulatory protein